ncbi:hydroxymethylglutaryl-CoA reductase, degradative [Psychroflexus maritimus]|uniref:3-hydroxy-3-methylglutaryl coenzyme A reductase n=1 Tax=Psychroflexus maritimus TaxID=2714865 RepID=A0A967AM12_9FLAO|nr:hydroxymethylglutaryl-CoA reductase, degradative [Psychroflexus maritimus]NGZ90794.1 hydroxymethylglutaryl-CoA reductase, degradative [Psychroflexus maritimus]
MKLVEGFSKLSKKEKIEFLTSNYLNEFSEAEQILKQYLNQDGKLQRLHDEFIENTLTNFYLPFGVAPNFTINNKNFVIPMAIEESSVVAAAAKAAKFWGQRGGFKAQVLGTQKVGQVHFTYAGNETDLTKLIKQIQPDFKAAVKSITKNMEKRGGGINEISLRNKTTELANYYQLHCTFETKDAMGANFINSCLEEFAQVLKEKAALLLPGKLEVIMSILSNYVPNCLVKAEVSCPVIELGKNRDEAEKYAHKFIQAIQIAEIEPYRAVTHNKGIMNGIDAVVLATGNDFRAVEAGVHAFASKEGRYKSLTHAKIENDEFKFWIEIPLALGTVGGLTSLHPLVKLALALLQHPSAEELMKIVAVAGLAQNFGAVNSLVTTGIQQGHMKMHLMNILNQFEANLEERQQAVDYFKSNTVTHSSVVDFLHSIRS